MGRVLKLALEGEQVEIVEGMFIAVPIGTGEDVRSLSTEAFGETIKKAANKVWEWIIKIAAAIGAAVKGFLNTFFGKTRRHRGMNDEVKRNYELLIKKFSSRKPLTVEDKVQSVIKADKLDEKFADRISQEAKAFLISEKYKKGIDELIALLTDDQHRRSMLNAANAFVGAITKPGQNDAAQLAQIRSTFEAYLKPTQAAFVEAKEGIDEAKSKDFKVPEIPREQAAVVSGAFERLKELSVVLKLEKWRSTIGDIERMIKSVEDGAKRRAAATERVGYEDPAIKSLQDALKLYWELLKGYMSAIGMVSKYEGGLWRLTDEIVRFRREALNRTLATVSGNERKEIEDERNDLFEGEMKNLFRFEVKDMF